MEAPRSEDIQPVGRLHLFSNDRGPEKDFLLYPGRNTIGRRPDCTVILPFGPISKVHAVIEIPAEGRAPFLRDCLSLNGTYFERPLRCLIPGTNYQLNDKDLLLFADLPCQFHYLGDPPLPDAEGAIEVAEILSALVIGEPPLPGTSLANDCKEEGDHGVRASLPGPASDLQPGSPEKSTSSRSQATDNPNTEIKEQSVQSDMDNQDEQDSPDVTFVSNKAPGSEAPAPAWSPRQTRSQKKRISKWVHSSASPDTQESSSLGWGREVKRARGKQSGRGQGLLQAPNVEPLLPLDSRDILGSSFQREPQEPFSSSSAPTTSLAAELHPAIPKELSIRTESRQQTPKRQKQGPPRKHRSTPVVPVFPQHPRESSESLKEPPRKAGGIPGSNLKIQPKVKIQHLTAVTKEPSPCPKKRRRGLPQKCAAREKEGDNPVEVETAVKTHKGRAELTLQSQEQVTGMPHQSVGQPNLDEEVRALRSGRKIRMKSGTFRPTAQEEAQKEQAGKAPDDNKAESVPESSD